MGNIFKTHFSQAKCNVEEKIKKMTGSGLALKRKRKIKKSLSQGKRRKVKDIFTGKEKEEIIECTKSGLDIFLKRSIDICR